MSNALSWFEIPAIDIDRATDFYSKIFDKPLVRGTMGQNPMAAFPYEQGIGVGGAVIQGEGYEPTTNGSVVYLEAGSDLQAVLDRVPTAGGTPLTPKLSIGENGYIAFFIDSEGNRVGLHSMN